MSVDLEPAEDGARFGLGPRDGIGQHYQGDVRDFIEGDFGQPRDWDLMIAHPECRYLSRSGLHWNKRRPGREAETEKALAFVRWLMERDIPRIVIENPRGCISTRLASVIMRRCFIRQSVQPNQFGDDASKETMLYLRNVPELRPTLRVPGRVVEWPKGSDRMVERWNNQTDSGQNRLVPSETRAMDRARTYPGIAYAMAQQIGG
ncbi:MAG: hypothetical protein ACREDH_12150 [Methylocella sp.]